MATHREINEAVKVYDNRRGWWFWAIAGIAVAIFAVTIISAAVADHEVCQTRTEAAERLSTKYLEALKGMGTISDKAILEVWVARSGGWTIFATDAKGCSRLIASGENWQDVPWRSPLPGKDS